MLSLFNCNNKTEKSHEWYKFYCLPYSLTAPYPGIPCRDFTVASLFERAYYLLNLIQNLA
jgi:hypothetical protein